MLYIMEKEAIPKRSRGRPRTRHLPRDEGAEPKPKVTKTPKQEEVWKRCQNRRVESLHQKKEQKRLEMEALNVVQEAENVIVECNPELHDKLDRIKEQTELLNKRKMEHMERIARIWEEVKREKCGNSPIS